MIRKLKMLSVIKTIWRLLDYRKKSNNIYKVEFVYKSYDLAGKEPFHINIVIPKLHLQYYYDIKIKFGTTDVFYSYMNNSWDQPNMIPFTSTELDSNYHIKRRSIEISDQLQNLLKCDDKYSNTLAKEIMFQKLGL